MKDFFSYCSHCKSLGHLKQECSILHPLITPTINPISIYGVENVANDVHENTHGDVSVDLFVHENVDHVVVRHLDNGHLIHPSNAGDVGLSTELEMLVLDISFASAIIPVSKNIVDY
ncbi:hypothetical protein IEQ34_021604 [Dendrobium chrysotoxum]|uniref:CCHC-type domain-containing protein n=1 Tax=Dendrobium chrysotoxum TaxID=161865 RepID=A0AAV7G3Z4_DENCH|nr:hypothetical protein IEQ34_021604 [Dendrobium chrysotoxum]